MDPNEILKHGLEAVKHAPELATGAAAVIGAFKFTEITKAMLGPATGEVAERIHDRVRLYRYGRQLALLKKAEKMAKDAGFTPKTVPIKLLFPLLEGASLEEDEDLHTMWAALLANASNERGPSIRPLHLDILRILSPDEAKLLQHAFDVASKFVRDEYHGNPRSMPLSSVAVGTLHDLMYSYGELGLSRLSGAELTSTETLVDNDGREEHVMVDRDRFYNCLEGLVRQRLIVPALLSFDESEIPATYDTIKLPSDYVLTSLGFAFVDACRTPVPGTS